uniref:Retrovirus-related Pol polyprotein from transposon TNT 1-94-like beta-barrel domain-containing protein n=1 Tax=Peronospora matthiolae TaxID=2874970 RepID=A0AAV1TNS0_9STRA
MVAVCDACGGGAEAQVLDNIVHYASADLTTVLMAKYNIDRHDHLRQAEELAHLHSLLSLRTKPEGRWDAKKERPKERQDDGEVVLAVIDDGDKVKDDWILDSGASRHLVKDDRLLIEAEICNDVVSLADNEKVGLSTVDSVRLSVVVNGKEKTVKLTDVYYSPSLARNIINYVKLDQKGHSLEYSNGKRSGARRSDDQVSFDVTMENSVLNVETVKRVYAKRRKRML